MRKDKVSMKSILENARALRTASLSGRKKEMNRNQSPLQNKQSLKPMPVNSNRSDSMFLTQSSAGNIRNQQFCYPNHSYEFSQSFSQQKNNFMNLEPRQMNEKLQFSQLSQMSQYSQPFQYSDLQFTNKIEKEKARAEIDSLAIQSIRQINEKLKKQFEGCLRMKNIRIDMEENFKQLRSKKQLDLVKFVKNI